MIRFFKNNSEEKAIRNYIEALEKEMVYDAPIVTQVVAFEKFWKAEEYHQDFERNNPNQSYVRAVSVPRLNRFKANFKSFLNFAKICPNSALWTFALEKAEAQTKVLISQKDVGEIFCEIHHLKELEELSSELPLLFLFGKGCL